MASKIKVDQIEGSTGSTITVPTGQTFTITDGLAASSIGSGTLAEARLPTVSVAKGGTNLSSFTAGDLLYATGSTTLAKLAKGSASQELRMNSGATAPEWYTPSGGGGKWGQHVIGDLTAAVAGITSINTYVSWATPFKVTITPTATSSKVLVRTGFMGSIGGSPGKFGIYQSSSLLKETGIYGSSAYWVGMEVLHSANTTSATTYEVKAAVTTSGGHNIYVYSGASASPPWQAWISATEILA